MKKIIVFLMATVSIFVLAACTSKTASDDVTFTSASGYLCSKDGASIQTEEPGTSPSRANDERIEPFTPTDSSTWGFFVALISLSCFAPQFGHIHSLTDKSFVSVF